MRLEHELQALPVLLLFIFGGGAFATFAAVWLIGLYERGKAAAIEEHQQTLRMQDQLAGRSPLKLDQYDATPELARFRLRFALRLGVTGGLGWPLLLWGQLPWLLSSVLLTGAVIASYALAPRVPPMPPSE